MIDDHQVLLNRMFDYCLLNDINEDYVASYIKKRYGCNSRGLDQTQAEEVSALVIGKTKAEVYNTLRDIAGPAPKTGNFVGKHLKLDTEPIVYEVEEIRPRRRKKGATVSAWISDEVATQEEAMKSFTGQEIIETTCASTTTLLYIPELISDPYWTDGENKRRKVRL